LPNLWVGVKLEVTVRSVSIAEPLELVDGITSSTRTFCKLLTTICDSSYIYFVIVFDIMQLHIDLGMTWEETKQKRASILNPSAMYEAAPPLTPHF
jgi:hypothetical protein